jgi:hypothetical protein
MDGWRVAANQEGEGMDPRLDLLDSAWHKLRLAAYRAQALLDVLGLHPTEDKAHLEGLAYTGTAAAEKTLRCHIAFSWFVMRDDEPKPSDVTAGRRHEGGITR